MVFDSGGVPPMPEDTPYLVEIPVGDTGSGTHVNVEIAASFDDKADPGNHCDVLKRFDLADDAPAQTNRMRRCAHDRSDMTVRNAEAFRATL